jgi:putative tryptophan/tyrosine transport system substrate-binding protein
VKRPIGMGLVGSLAHRGATLRACRSRHPIIAGKRLELLREIVPNLRRLAVMANVANSQVLLEVREVEAAAGTLGLTIVLSEIQAGG